MASYGQAGPTSMTRPGQPPSDVIVPGGHHNSSAPQGTFASGTKIQVGSHRVVILKYLSEGGFAHVYLVRLPSPVNGTDQAVLKRVAVPDKDALRGMRTEVETMKRLKGHRAIVTYIDSHASEMRGGGYEVFLLMEFCNGGGLMDFMNTRLQHRLTEPEILGIFSDVAEGVACMHYLKPPLLHRDLKVENVLITNATSTQRRRFKLCDFGSAAPPKAAPVSVVECRLMDEDVQRHTTLQYRSPEMIDVYRRQPIDEKSDIWALGVLLYKLCYYTTPFEDQSSQLAILNASYRFPSHPIFSDRLKSLIASMLRENQQSRPNIYQVLREACAMQGKEVPIKDIYSGKARPESKTSDRTPAADKSKPTPVVGAVFSPPAKKEQVIPEVVPMRRGRPTAPTQSSSQVPKPSPSPLRVTTGDPFAALDTKAAAAKSSDAASSKFPSLDQFSLLNDHSSRFSFDETSPSQPKVTATTADARKSREFSQRITDRLADEAFATSASTSTTSKVTPQAAAAVATAAVASGKVAPPLGSKPVAGDSKLIPSKPYAVTGSGSSDQTARTSKEMSRASAIISNTPELQAISSQASLRKFQQPQQRPQQEPGPRPNMVSTGTMTSPSPPPPEVAKPQKSQYQIYRFPPSDQSSHIRASSVPRKQYQDASGGHSLTTGGPSPALMPQTGHTRQPSSSRPSLETSRPDPEALEPTGAAVRTSRQRPVSAYLDSNMDYLREREVSTGGGSGGSGRHLLSHRQPSPMYGEHKKPASPLPDQVTSSSNAEARDEPTIESNVAFLRSQEAERESKWDKGLHHHHSKHGSKHGKRSSTSGSKNIFAGKFGDAFKRFETTGSSSSSNAALAPARTPSPLKQLERKDSMATGNDYNDDYDDTENAIDDQDPDVPPEVRREIERRRLSMEEKRVAAAGAEYRQRLAQRNTGSGTGSSGGGVGGRSTPPPPLPPKSIGGVSRAVSIQNRVQSLLSESQSTGNVAKTAQGYGHFTDSDPDRQGSNVAAVVDHSEVRRKPLSRTGTASPDSQPRAASGAAPKPPAKPKPSYLNKALPAVGNSTGGTAVRSSSGARPGSPTTTTSQRPLNVGSYARTSSLTKGSGSVVEPSGASSTSQLIAMDLPGQPVLEGMTLQDRDDYIQDFTRRFPSLTTIEMVERDLAAEDRTERR